MLIVSHDAKIAEEVGRVVAIRDGKTSAEIVRAGRSAESVEAALVGMAESANATNQEFVEVAVLDSAGRVQIPKELRDKLGINRRAIIEQTEHGVIIRPAD